jgi:enamine deaminase RidA (YjgF/YER057c/UK114 family)
VVKWNVYVVAGNPALPAFQTFQRLAGEQPHPPTVSLVYVAAHAHPDFLIEIDAVAAVPLDN